MKRLMMDRKLSKQIKTILLVVLISTFPFSVPAVEKVVVLRCSNILLDGKLNEPEWQTTTAYTLVPGKPFSWGRPIIERTGNAKKVSEAGTVRFLYDENYLYIGLMMTDSDLVGEAVADEERLYMQGDCIEIFIHPRKQTYYWELYAAINEKKTAFFFPGRGRLNLPSNSAYACNDMLVRSTLNGSLNKWQDRDKGWNVEIAVPISSLTKFGAKFDRSEDWSILIVRYNYSRYLPIWEISCYPEMTSDNPHLYEDYITMDFEN